MPTDSAKSHRPSILGIECEALEGDHGGVARLTRKLVEQLNFRGDLKSRWKFRLYFKNAVPPEFRALDPEVFTTIAFHVPSFSIYYYVLLPLRLWWDRPDFMVWPNYMLPIIHPPYVRSAVMLTEDIYREARNPLLPFQYRLAYRIFATGWAAHFASVILAISESSRKALVQEGISPKRILVNPLGVDVPRAGVTQDVGEYLLYVGQAFPRRHLRETLQAFARLAAERPDIRLEVIGTDLYHPPFFESAMREVNRALDRQAVSLRAHVSDEELAAAYAGARALIYVSDTEAFGLPPLEALSFGTPSVVADVPVNREIYGSNAFYAQSASVNDIYLAMIRALDDNAHRDQIRRATTEILSRYTWRGYADRLLDRLEKVLEKRRKI